jgi:crotonobetainyl-CoA:carnitine CoA-transferase CaiB-like acyl-CoA transferase
MGFVCGALLASMGVDVIKIEPPGGDPSRSLGPFYRDVPDPERSLYWKAFNVGKRGITLDVEHERGSEILLRLVNTADFVVESFRPGFLDSIGCGFEALRRRNPKLVLVSITPFGQHGPYSRYVANDLVAAAMGGVLDNTGDVDRAPVKEPLESIYFHGGLAGAFGGLLAHFHSRRSASGQHVDVSLQHCGLTRCSSSIAAWQFDKALMTRKGSQTTLGPVTSRWIWECRDGHIFWHMLGGLIGAPANEALSNWMDEVGVGNPLREVADWKTFDKAGQTQDQWDRFERAIGAFFRRFTKTEIDGESQKRGVNAASAQDPAGVYGHAQLAARGYWQEVDDPTVGPLRLPRYFFRSDRVPTPAASRPAPTIGQDNTAVYEGELGIRPSALSTLRGEHVI